MNTFLHSYIESLDNTWKEIDLLCEEAIIHHNKNNLEIYNAICRSITVLLVSHLEGFLKELCRNIIKDLALLPFKDLPNNIKRQHCIYFLGQNDHSKVFNEKVNKLISNLDQYTNYRISTDSFEENTNDNPKPSIVEKYADKLGTKNIFKYIHNSDVERLVFGGGSPNSLERAFKLLQWSVKKKTKNYPYKITPGFLNLSIKENSPKCTLWEEFLHTINFNRHQIAHGNNFINNTSITNLLEDKWKTRILQLTIILIVCQNLCNS